MFLRPFLKYFKPFIPRLALAVFCMIMVGVLAAAPLLILREAMTILLAAKPAAGEMESSADLTAEQKRALKLLIPGQSGGANDADHAEHAPAALRRVMAQTGMSAADVEASAAFTAEEKAYIAGVLSEDAAATATLVAAADASTTATATAAVAKPPFRKRADAWLESNLGGLWTGPRHGVKQGAAWVKATAAGVGAPLMALREQFHEYAKDSPYRALVLLVAISIVLGLLKGLAEFVSKLQLTHTFFFTNLAMREDIFRNVLRQDYLFFSKRSVGFLHSRINSDAKDIKGIIDAMLTDAIQYPVSLTVLFVFLVVLSPQLTLGVLLVLPISIGLLYRFARTLRRNTRRQKKKSDELSGGMTESLTNIRLVKAFGTEELEGDKLHERAMQLFHYVMARRVAKFGSGPVMEFLGVIAAGAVMLLGGWMILSTPPQISFVDFGIYLLALAKFYRPMKMLAGVTNKYQIARVSAERMTEMLELKPKILEAPNPVPFFDLSEAVEFRDIELSYGRTQVLNGVSLRVERGQKVAFAGASGAGKTTLINLLVRLFDPTGGAIYIDGVDLREIAIKDWRAKLAIVTQETYLFDLTVAQNIAYGSPELDMTRVEAAARAANAHDFIVQLAGGKGYDAKLGPMGHKLSGGQRQRIAIARALYRDPKILILDEATSALDIKSQALVQEALGKLMEGRTTFIVAHRISTIRNVDCIYVLDNGRVAEQGTHNELVARGGLYASMAAGPEARATDDGDDLAEARNAISAMADLNLA